jgi:hypothetical protein
LLLVAGLALLAGCSKGDDEPVAPSTTAAATKATVPDSVDPDEGWLTLETDAVHLEVTACTGVEATSTSQTARQVFELVATGKAGSDEITVTATQEESSVDAKAVTQTITVTSGTGADLVGLQAKRSYFGGRWVDLLEPSAKTPLFEQDGKQIEATAKFGPQGSKVGDKGVVDGAFIAECPEGGG